MVIRDPVHGDIFVTKELQLLLDTPEMQRLRGIKQLGTAYLVYPGALHTRFDHSLGTMAMARRIIAALRRQGCSIDQVEEEMVAAAALVHDVTHIPFGHTFEDERKVFWRHDTPARFRAFLSQGGLGGLLDELGWLRPVLALLTGEPPKDWMASIISGTVDADLLDYLRRDRYFTGLTQDYDDRIFHYFALDGEELILDLTKKGLDRPDARSETVNLLRLRYFLTERVYYHHAKVIAGAMISKAVEMALALGLREQELYGLSDEGLFAHLITLAQTDPGSGIAELVQRVRERRLYKRAFVLSGRSLGEDGKKELISRFLERAGRVELERFLAEEADVKQHQVIVYCPETPVLKEASVKVRTTDGLHPLDDPDYLQGREVRFLQELYADLWRFYVLAPPEAAEKVGQVAATYFGPFGRERRF